MLRANGPSGRLGGPPETAWVIGYPLLERIHYLLVAGFDVFGNVGHQLTTRTFMDFLRMEGESNFLMFLPTARRGQLIANWYRGVNGTDKARVEAELLGFGGAPHISYQTAAPEQELYAMLRPRVGRVLAHRYELQSREASLERLGRVHGLPASWLPETSFLTVREANQTETHFSILRESAHTNVAHLLGEDYRALRLRFGVLRGSDRFWQHSDRINGANRKLGPIDSGRFDYSRLEPL